MTQHGGTLPTEAVGRAMQLVAAVRDYEALNVADILNVDRAKLNAMCVALAAMVDVDSTPRELLAWNDGLYLTPTTKKRAASVQRLLPHGTHAAFVRHKKRLELPCDLCRDGERAYQRERKRRSRAVAS